MQYRQSGRRGLVVRLILLLAAASALGGCAGNALRVEGAAAVGRAAGVFTETASAALDDAKARRIEANAALVASDASCEPTATINVYVGDASAGGTPLCADGSTPLAGYVLRKVDLRPWGEESLKPTLLLIGAIGDYGAALGKVADRPNADIGKELAALAAKANEAGALANGLLGLDIPDAEKLLASKQAATAIALVQFANNLAEEQAKVRDIRRLVDERGDTVMALLPELRGQLKQWTLIHAQGDAEIIENSLRRAYRQERGNWDYSKRFAFVTAFGKARSDADAYPQRLRALEKGLDAFAFAETDLRRLLRGEFTQKERKRIAALNQQRLVEAFGLMARAISAFGGL